MTTAKQALERIVNRTSNLDTYTEKELIFFAKYFAKIHHKEQLRIGGVSQQRELLLDFLNKHDKSLTERDRTEYVDEYLESNNCG